jgi:rhodanese-related sulfurtransferase
VPRSVEELLADARARLTRVEPLEAKAAADRGEALIVDIRQDRQRERDGVVPGAVFVPRNELEWRADPVSQWRDDRLHDGRRVVVMCDEGYQSSLAAAVLHELGLEGATDLVGGFQSWRSAGLPVDPLA